MLLPWIGAAWILTFTVWWHWLFVVGLVALMFWAVVGSDNLEEDESTFPFLVLIGSLGLVAGFTTFNPFLWIWTNLSLVAIAAIVYFIIAAPYTYSKFRWSFVPKKIEYFKKYQQESAIGSYKDYVTRINRQNDNYKNEPHYVKEVAKTLLIIV